MFEAYLRTRETREWNAFVWGLWPSLLKACSFCLVILFKDRLDSWICSHDGAEPQWVLVFRMLWEGLVTVRQVGQILVSFSAPAPGMAGHQGVDSGSRVLVDVLD